ncbi:zinc metallopeptidase [Motiliproteus sp. MSK22-1]|uniref:zinc metallopeptidase n=1 Tax=Motiliproteus sp. MSK22-1 TaxID=1897630 RepID=UPI0009774867|nr:zinc metallopeptidase [Motiliproteus sp. MSK22-1]OMH39370.1 hypothetical protein BGP75_03395 [Motiliproteus sp. MSK22-1]
MDLLIIGLSILLLLVAPKLWARYIFFKHSHQRRDIPGTGGQLAQHLMVHLPLVRVKLKQAHRRSHYNPFTKVISLTEQTMRARSLTAVVRVAFEFGHALQDRNNNSLLKFRDGLLALARLGEQIGSGALLTGLIMAFMVPPVAGLLLFVALVSLLTGAAVHLLLLPIEWQASFTFALPLLSNGSYISSQDQLAVRQLLLACAFSRLAYALANLLDARHWLSVLEIRKE